MLLLTFLWIINEELYRRVDTIDIIFMTGLLRFAWRNNFTGKGGDWLGVISWILKQFKFFMKRRELLLRGLFLYCRKLYTLTFTLFLAEKDLLYVFMYDIYPFSVHYAFSLAFFRVKSLPATPSELLRNSISEYF